MKNIQAILEAASNISDDKILNAVATAIRSEAFGDLIASCAFAIGFSLIIYKIVTYITRN